MRPLTIPLIAAALLLGLTGCVPGTGGNPLNPAGDPVSPGAPASTTTDSPDPSGTDRPDTDQRCADGQPLELDGQGLEFRVTGACGAVIVRGQDLDIELESAASILIEGQRTEIESRGGIGGLEIRGDDNDVSSDDSIDAVSISGQANEIEAPTIGSVAIQGGGNVIESDNEPSGSVGDDGNVVKRRD
ncbi:MAG: hypothetical protein ABWY53_04500 [Leifsonia flava]